MDLYNLYNLITLTNVYTIMSTTQNLCIQCLLCHLKHWFTIKCHINGITLYILICEYLLSVSMMLMRVIYFVVCISSWLFFNMEHYFTIYLLTFLLINIWIITSLWLFYIKLLCIFLFKSSCGHILVFLLGKYPGVKLHGHRISVCLTL